ncbi:hypothetical protein ABH915_002159 [Arthrobacter sp. MW3 TE3886]
MRARFWAPFTNIHGHSLRRQYIERRVPTESRSDCGRWCVRCRRSWMPSSSQNQHRGASAIPRDWSATFSRPVCFGLSNGGGCFGLVRLRGKQAARISRVSSSITPAISAPVGVRSTWALRALRAGQRPAPVRLRGNQSGGVYIGHASGFGPGRTWLGSGRTPHVSGGVECLWGSGFSVVAGGPSAQGVPNRGHDQPGQPNGGEGVPASQLPGFPGTTHFFGLAKTDLVQDVSPPFWTHLSSSERHARH